jgi:peptidoglycan/LPS O-acetylase OafA/YrhL
LAYEWWYYCLFALILELLGKRRTDLFFWIFAAALLLAVAVLPAHLLLYMLIWGMGACVAILDSERFKFSPYVGWALFVSLLLGSRLFHILMDGYVNGYPGSMFIRFVPNLLLAAGFSILIVSLRGRSCAILRHLAFHKHMADFSYTIYLMHVPLLVFITAILSSNYGVSFFVQPASQVFLYSAAIVPVIYIALYLFSLLTERFTPNVKACLTGLIFANRLESKAGAVR